MLVAAHLRRMVPRVAWSYAGGDRQNTASVRLNFLHSVETRLCHWACQERLETNVQMRAQILELSRLIERIIYNSVWNFEQYSEVSSRSCTFIKEFICKEALKLESVETQALLESQIKEYLTLTRNEFPGGERNCQRVKASAASA